MSTFDPFTATLEEALAAGDQLAVARWGGAQMLLARREFYERHPLDGIAVCCSHDLVAPDWLAGAFLGAFDKVARCHVPTWDDAFGAPFPKGVKVGHLARARQRQRMRVAIFNDVLDAARSSPARPLAELVEAAGRTHGAGRTLADELYREAVALFGFGARKLKATAAARQNTARSQSASSRKLAGINRRR